MRQCSQMRIKYRYLPHDSRPGLVGVGSGRGKSEYDLKTRTKMYQCIIVT